MARQLFSDPVIVAMIGTVQSIVLALIAAWLKRSQDSNHAETKQDIATAQGSIEGVRKEVNGKMNDLLQVTSQSERAIGNLEGRAAESAEREGATIQAKADAISDRVVPSLVEQLPDKIADKLIPQLRPARKKEPGQ